MQGTQLALVIEKL